MASRADRSNLTAPQRNNFAVNDGDFRTLGLARSESRAEIIRRATSRRVNLVKKPCAAPVRSCREKQLDHVAKISLAAYRLLDPRRRNQVGERVVLSYPLDRHEAEPIQLAPLQILQVPRRLDSWQWTKSASASNNRTLITADVSNPESVRYGVTDEGDSKDAIADQADCDQIGSEQSEADRVVADRAALDGVVANKASNIEVVNFEVVNNEAISDELVQTRQIVRYLRLVRRRELVKRRNWWLIRLMGPLVAMFMIAALLLFRM